MRDNVISKNAKKHLFRGDSLGGAVAANIASRTQPAALILESTFRTTREVAKEMFPYLPVSLFIHEDYNTPEKLSQMTIPLLVIHSSEDEIIPFQQGKSLYDEYSGPKHFLRIHGSHNTGFLESAREYRKTLQQFLENVPVDTANFFTPQSNN